MAGDAALRCGRVGKAPGNGNTMKRLQLMHEKGVGFNRPVARLSITAV
jgi:hypothetical protein